MSEKTACPSGKFECLNPLDVSCSFKGCEPFDRHHSSFNVLYLGQKGRSLREKTTAALCQGGYGTLLELSDPYKIMGSLSLRIKATDVGLKLSAMNMKYLKYEKVNGVASNASMEDASTFHIDFGSCSGEQLTIEPLDERGLYLNILNMSWHRNPQCHEYKVEKCRVDCGLHHCHRNVPGSDVVWGFIDT